jgi:hypothetical protein
MVCIMRISFFFLKNGNTDSSHHYAPVSTRDHTQSPEVAPAVNKTQYYQAVVDTAQK